MAWSKKGSPAIVPVPTTKANATSILGAISATGLINVSLRVPKRIKKRKLGRETGGYSTGTVIGHYLSFVKATLDEMDKYPEMKGHYLVMDNAPIHSSTDIGKYIHSRGYKFVYLPPYSPELNPIEQFWSVVKSKVKRNKFLEKETLMSRISEACDGLYLSDFKSFVSHSAKCFGPLLLKKPCVKKTYQFKYCSIQMETVLTNRLQFSKRPGPDQTSKFILKHHDVKSVATKAIVDIDGDAYRIGDAEWDDGTRSDVLYEPVNEFLQQPPIIVEVQTTVDAEFMNRAVHYCVMAYRRYKTLPTLLIFATNTTTIPTDNMHRSNVFCGLSLPCEYWAKKCYLINLASASSQSVERETELLDAITSVCDASIKHYEQILNTVESLRYDSPNIRQEVVCGMQKLQQFKRRFEEVDGLQEPIDQANLVTSADEERYQNTMEYVEKYKTTRKRMNWRDRHDQLRQKSNVIKYKNPEVLHVQFIRFKAISSFSSVHFYLRSKENMNKTFELLSIITVSK
ncbi:hypothetical protein G6F38_005988 [Rhizopus arrhizus]|nr:hypothetical protein G6F38_005988 [Rhizopus arrhizus]